MKAISFWAKENPRKAQLSIVLLYIIINVLAVYAGQLLYDFDIRLHPLLFNIALFVFLLCVLLYRKKGRYVYRKTLDITLISSTFVLLVFGANQLEEQQMNFPISSMPANGITINKSESSKNETNTKTTQRSVRKKLKKERRKINVWSQVLLITLVVAGALVSIYLIGILSCNLSCSGAEGLAIVVLVVGLVAVLGGAYLLIRRILGYRKKNIRSAMPEMNDNDR